MRNEKQRRGNQYGDVARVVGMWGRDVPGALDGRMHDRTRDTCTDVESCSCRLGKGGLRRLLRS